MSAESRWLDLLKAPGPQLFAIGAACLAFLYAVAEGWLPRISDQVRLLVAAFMLLCLFLWLATVWTWATGKASTALGRWRSKRARAHFLLRLADEIETFSPKELEIVAYLLVNDMRMFQGDLDGGNAATLIARRVVVRGNRGPMITRMNEMPWKIEDDVWEVLYACKEKFPLAAAATLRTEPWRKHWMA